MKIGVAHHHVAQIILVEVDWATPNSSQTRVVVFSICLYVSRPTFSILLLFFLLSWVLLSSDLYSTHRISWAMNLIINSLVELVEVEANVFYRINVHVILTVWVAYEVVLQGSPMKSVASSRNVLTTVSILIMLMDVVISLVYYYHSSNTYSVILLIPILPFHLTSFINPSFLHPD